MTFRLDFEAYGNRRVSVIGLREEYPISSTVSPERWLMDRQHSEANLLAFISNESYASCVK